MTMLILNIRFALLTALCLSSPLRADVQTLKENQVPGRIRGNMLVISTDWAGQIPPSGEVNAPVFLKDIHPGQKIALAFMAEGSDRDQLLAGLKVNVSFASSTRDVVEEHDLKPVAIRRIKAEGADMVMQALKAAGIAQKDRASLEVAMSVVTLAVFQPDWAAPLAEQAEEIQIIATISGSPTPVTLEPITIKLRPDADWLNEPLPSRDEIGKYMNRYHEDMAPGHLLLLLKAAASDGSLNSGPIRGFFAIAYRENIAARNAAVALFPSLDPKTQKAFMYVLGLGGQDVGGLLPGLFAEIVARMKPVKPMGDPRNLPHFHDPVDIEEVRGVGHAMDLCWGGWMATGDQSYLRALVGLLEGAPDYPAFQSWTKERGGVKGLNAQVARGLAYQIAGWSIGSFQRSDPHVMDWLLFWKEDVSFPPLLRKEITEIPANPAFQRK